MDFLPEVAASVSRVNEMDMDAHAAATSGLIREAWGRWGTVDDALIAHLVNPAFMGGPQWPALRQAHSVTRRGRSVMIASDGLADPATWSDAAPSNGYGVEVYGISADRFDKTDTVGLATSWLGDVVMSTSRLIAQHGFGFTDTLERNGMLTVAFPGAELPGPNAGAYVDDTGAVVVMLGLTDSVPPERVDGPLSPIRLVNVKLLTVAEADYCVKADVGSGEARRELAGLFVEQGWSLYSSLDRPSVV